MTYVNRGISQSLSAVSNNGMELRYIPSSYITYEVSMAAVSDDGLAIVHVPYHQRTRELCAVAIKQNPLALEHSPFQNQELCDYAAEKDPSSLQFIHEIHKTDELCMKAVIKEPWVIRWAKQNPELCLLAVQKDPKTIRDIKFKTKEVCEAVVNNPFVGAGKYLPEEYKNRFDKFYEENGYLIIGPLIIFKECIQCFAVYSYGERLCGDNACDHETIQKDGSSKRLSSQTIIKEMEKNCIITNDFSEFLDSFLNSSEKSRRRKARKIIDRLCCLALYAIEKERISLNVEDKTDFYNKKFNSRGMLV